MNEVRMHDAIVVENVGLVLSQDTSSLRSAFIPADEFYSFTGDITATVELPIAEVRPASECLPRNPTELYGSWLESGDEDRRLQELYDSRLHQ